MRDNIVLHEMESLESFMSDKNRLACLEKFNDRVEDSRQVHGEEHKYEVWLKEGWVFGGEIGDDRRYESFCTKREMVKAVKAAHILV